MCLSLNHQSFTHISFLPFQFLRLNVLRLSIILSWLLHLDITKLSNDRKFVNLGMTNVKDSIQPTETNSGGIWCRDKIKRDPRRVDKKKKKKIADALNKPSAPNINIENNHYDDDSYDGDEDDLHIANLTGLRPSLRSKPNPVVQARQR